MKSRYNQWIEAKSRFATVQARAEEIRAGGRAEEKKYYEGLDSIEDPDIRAAATKVAKKKGDGAIQRTMTKANDLVDKEAAALRRIQPPNSVPPDDGIGIVLDPDTARIHIQEVGKGRNVVGSVSLTPGQIALVIDYYNTNIAEVPEEKMVESPTQP